MPKKLSGAPSSRDTPRPPCKPTTSLTALKAGERLLNKARKKPYDGFNGELPEWFPMFFRNVFGNIRAALLADKSSADKVVGYIQAYAERDRLKPGFHGVTPIPGNILGSVSILYWMHEAAKLGKQNERDGFNYLLGDEPGHAMDMRRNLKKNLNKHIEPARRAHELVRASAHELAKNNPSLENNKSALAAQLIAQCKHQGRSKRQLRRILKTD